MAVYHRSPLRCGLDGIKGLHGDQAGQGKRVTTVILVMIGVFIDTLVFPAGLAEASDPPLAVAGQPASQTLTPAQLQQAIHRYLTDWWDEKVSRIRVRLLVPLEAISVPAGRIGLKVEPIGLVMHPGRALFWVRVSVNGRIVRKQKVAAEIQAYAKVALTTRAIQQGEILTEADLQLTEWRIRAIEHGLVVSPDEAIGKRIQLRISEGRPIPRAALEEPEVSPVGEKTTMEGDSEAGSQSSVPS